MAFRQLAGGHGGTAPNGMPGFRPHPGSAIISGHNAFIACHEAFGHTAYIGEFAGELIPGE